MEHTKANFRALRESLGMSQQVLANLLGVETRSVKRWESPSETAYKGAPDDAWNLLEEYKERQRWAIDTALDKFADIEEEMGEAPRSANLTYWSGPEEYEKAHPGEGPLWQMANANTRLLAAFLEYDGYSVEYGFPGLRAILPEKKVTIYKVVCTKAWNAWTTGWGWSLEPWPGNGPYTEGFDDGGREYVLPVGFELGELRDGSPAIFEHDGKRALRLVGENGPEIEVGNTTVKMRPA